MSWIKTRTFSWIACAALLAGAVEAQVEGAGAVATTAETTQEKLDELIKRYNKQQREVFEAYEKAATEEEQQKILQGLPGKEFVAEFRALAEEAKGTDTAVSAWMWVLRLTQGEPNSGLDIVKLLLAEHMGSRAIAELSSQLRHGGWRFGAAEVIEALRAIVADSPHETVRAAALFDLGGVLLESGTPENVAEGRDCFQAVIEEYGKLAYRDGTYATAAESYLYELDHLRIGMVAPDFETVDENGAKWKLSDYRGKVVVVDFWGFW